MGSCTSLSRKNKSEKNKIIISNSLKKPQSNSYPNSLSIIINQIIPEKTQINTAEEKTPISIGQNMSFKELFTQMHINMKSDYSLQFKENQLLENFDINNKIIETIYPYIKDNLNEVININLVYEGLDIPDNIIESYITHNKIISAPIFDNPDFFAIIIYYTESNELKLYYKEPKDPEYIFMNKFNSFTAYCNAKGYLYISGGEKEQTNDLDNNNNNNSELNDFFCIELSSLDCDNNLKPDMPRNNLNGNGLIDLDNLNDLNTFNIKQLPNLLEPRTWHSMIYVPNNYIFIVGGSTKSVELYDIEKNIIKKDSSLNELRNECTLCLVNNIYLYAFCGFYIHQSFNCTVERCNLRKKERKWEFVKFNMKNKGFISSFFAVSYYKNENIILIGGDSVEDINKSYIIKLGKEENENDEIDEFDLGEKKFGVFRDKFFNPINNNFSINIPLAYGEHIQTLLLNMDNGEIEQKDYNNLFNRED